jgi:hypothetical protein
MRFVIFKIAPEDSCQLCHRSIPSWRRKGTFDQPANSHAPNFTIHKKKRPFVKQIARDAAMFLNCREEQSI